MRDSSTRGGGQVALSPDSERREAGTPEDYAEHHPDEDARQWGWHGEWGGGARVAGWVIAAIVLLMATATNYQLEYHIALYLVAAIIVAIQILDRVRRRNSWRK
jgi:hypothetical protein